MKIYERYIKRILDIFFSLTLIILLLPFFLIIALISKINLKDNIIFKQNRHGKNGKLFNIYKFRTMTNEVDIDGILLPDKYRVTKYGEFLRKNSLDELPQLFNILFGQMSFVGPRPLMTDFLECYINNEKDRLNVKPGLTGLSQVNGRNNMTYPERFKTDIEYANKITFIQDVKIVIKTIGVVLNFNENNNIDTVKFLQERKQEKLNNEKVVIN